MTEEDAKKWFKDMAHPVQIGNDPDVCTVTILNGWHLEGMYQAIEALIIAKLESENRLLPRDMTPEERAAWVEKMVVKKEPT